MLPLLLVETSIVFFPYQERFLQKLQETVSLQAMRHQQEYLLLINLVSKFRPDGSNGNPKPPKPEGPSQTNSN